MKHHDSGLSFIVLGMNDEEAPQFSPDLQTLIAQHRIFSGGRRHRELVAALLPEDALWIDITVPLEDVYAQYRQHDAPVVVFASGDPLFFGFTTTLMREFPGRVERTVPSFSSLQMLAHALRLPYHDMYVVSLTGRPWHEFDRALIERRAKVGVLTDKKHTPSVIAQRMLDYGYEGYTMQEVTFPERVMYALGIKNLFLSNASGGTNPDFEIGDLMLITDHINFQPEHPLHGPNIPTGPRFPDMSEAYDRAFLEAARNIAREKGIKVVEGVYLADQGPTYETPAEYKMYRLLGADAVGMSTVPEVIVARHCGIRCFGISIITDLGVEGKIVEVSHEEVQKAANAVQPLMAEIFRELIKKID